MTRITIILTEQHLAYCEKLALARYQSAVRNARHGTNGAPDSGPVAEKIHRQGVFGECAAYLWLSPIKWHTYQEHGLTNLPDLADFIDVKTVGNSRHRLIVQKECPDAWAYLLVNAENHPRYAIEGWLWGYEAKVPKYLTDPVGGREAYFVPTRDLRPPEKLKEHYDAR